MANEHMGIDISSSKPTGEELAGLMSEAGWGNLDPRDLERSISSYTATICARTADNKLIGYVSVFSDGVLTTMFGEAIVHPEWRRKGLGKALFAKVENMFPDAPIYVKALGESYKFFEAIGFRCSKTPITAMFKHPDTSPENVA
jgi:predicted GNAT family N-acyltransferase